MRYAAALCLLLVACGSENKVGQEVDPGQTQEPGDLTTTTPDNPTGGDDPQDPGDDPETPDTDDPDTDEPDTDEPGTLEPDPNLTEEEICEKAAALTITLDPYQVPEDGRVVYCHSGSGNGYNYIESDISSCLPHLNHDFDVFPTTGCDN
jgi:hypothetical protein